MILSLGIIQGLPDLRTWTNLVGLLSSLMKVAGILVLTLNLAPCIAIYAFFISFVVVRTSKGQDFKSGKRLLFNGLPNDMEK